jgi:hypothetical protein
VDGTWTAAMIVLGADTDKRSQTIAAVVLATGQVLGEKPWDRRPRVRGAGRVGARSGRATSTGA